MQERIILFDLDGTQTDSGPGIMRASQFALRAYGVERDWQELDFFVGPPLDETFGQFMPKEDIVLDGDRLMGPDYCIELKGAREIEPFTSMYAPEFNKREERRSFRISFDRRLETIIQ